MGHEVTGCECAAAVSIQTHTTNGIKGSLFLSCLSSHGLPSQRSGTLSVCVYSLQQWRIPVYIWYTYQYTLPYMASYLVLNRWPRWRWCGFVSVRFLTLRWVALLHWWAACFIDRGLIWDSLVYARLSSRGVVWMSEVRLGQFCGRSILHSKRSVNLTEFCNGIHWLSNFVY